MATPRPPHPRADDESNASAPGATGAAAAQAAFSVREFRASLDSKVSDAKAAVQRRLGMSGDDERSASLLPTVTSITELARRPAKQMADTVARLTPDDNDLLNRVRTGVAKGVSGMRRSQTADQLSASSSAGADDEASTDADAASSSSSSRTSTMFNLPAMPAMPAMPLAPPALPEWDVFKSLKSGGGSGSGSDLRWNPPRPTPPSSLDALRKNIGAKLEERWAGGKPPAPGELLSQMRDAGDKAVHDFLVSARDKAERAASATATLGNRPRRRSMGSVERKSRVRSMTEEEFREAEAAAAAMELKLTALSEEEERATSAASASTSDVAKIPRADDERRRLASEAVSGGVRDATSREVGGRGSSGPGRSLRDPGRSVAIVTTAALPWMTGTAVNPLLRAAYLARRGLHDVTLVIPWLAPAEQKLIHPSVIFETPEEQGAYVRRWVKERCGFEPAMKLDFYPGRYATDKYSIIPVGDVSEYITDKKHDVAVLEEPEHLNWYHSGSRWSDKFDHVVGVVHTNYLEYARLEKHGEMKEAAMRLINSWVSRVHCHKIIKLSDAVQDFPRSETVNVHGVSPVFLEVGRRKATAAAQASAAEHDPDAAAAQAMGRTVSNVLASLSARSQRREASRRAKNDASGSSPEKRPPSPEAIHPSDEVFNKGCYFLGKVVWGKGFHELLQRVEEHNSSADGAKYPLEMDVFGSGEDFDAVTNKSREKGLPLTFRGRADHASDQMHDYKVFINPSLSDVVATTTAEALAMGKYVICAQHPSNAFFSTFPNCLTYDSPEQFSECVKRALSTDPAPLTSRDRYRLSWEAATDRFLDAAELGAEQVTGPGTGLGDKMAEGLVHALHSGAAKRETLRRAAGAGENTGKGPAKVDGTWDPPWTKR